MAYQYIRGFLTGYYGANFHPHKAALINDIRDNRMDSYKYFKIQVPKIGEIIEVPIMAYTHVKEILLKNSNVARTEIVNVPLIYKGNIARVNTFPAFVKNWMPHRRECKYLMPLMLKDELYYTYPGIILDKDYNLLFYVGLDVTADIVNITANTIKDKGIRVYISPKVFEGTTMLGKNMVKKVLPELFESQEDYRGSGMSFEIVLKEKKDFIFSPVEPKTSDVTQEAYDALERGLSQILENNEYV